MTVYEIITEKIINKMQEGIIPWAKPWERVRTYTFTQIEDFRPAYSYSTGKPYDIINQMLLGYTEGEYATFNQIAKAGGKVKKGEKSEIVCGWIVENKQKQDADGKPMVDEDGNALTEKTFGLRFYHVFNILTQCEDIKPKHDWTKVEKPKPKKVTKTTGKKAVKLVDSAEAIIKRYLDSKDAPTMHIIESDEAFYRPSDDSVTIPLPTQFKGVIEAYYSTAFHELTHSTGKDTRLDRQIKNVFGNHEYSKEELVAEIGSCFLMSAAGLDCEKTFNNSVAYLQNWLEVLKNDPKMIIFASAQAEKAVNYILNA